MDYVCNRCLFSIPSKVEMAEEQEYLRTVMFTYWFIAHSIHVCNITWIYTNSIFCPQKAFIQIPQSQPVLLKLKSHSHFSIVFFFMKPSPSAQNPISQPLKKVNPSSHFTLSRPSLYIATASQKGFDAQTFSYSSKMTHWIWLFYV